MGKLRSFFGAIEDWNKGKQDFTDRLGKHCDRSSGRSRIGTQNARTYYSEILIAIVLRGDRGLELE